jgi:hypothetical protein
MSRCSNFSLDQTIADARHGAGEVIYLRLGINVCIPAVQRSQPFEPCVDQEPSRAEYQPTSRLPRLPALDPADSKIPPLGVCRSRNLPGDTPLASLLKYRTYLRHPDSPRSSLPSWDLRRGRWINHAPGPNHRPITPDPILSASGPGGQTVFHHPPRARGKEK